MLECLLALRGACTMSPLACGRAYKEHVNKEARWQQLQQQRHARPLALRGAAEQEAAAGLGQ